MKDVVQHWMQHWQFRDKTIEIIELSLGDLSQFDGSETEIRLLGALGDEAPAVAQAAAKALGFAAGKETAQSHVIVTGLSDALRALHELIVLADAGERCSFDQFVLNQELADALRMHGEPSMGCLVELLEDGRLGQGMTQGELDSESAGPMGIISAYARALGHIGRPAVPALRKALADERAIVRRAAVEALETWGSHVKKETGIPELLEEVVHDLEQLVQEPGGDEDHFVRQKTRKAHRNIGANLGVMTGT